MKEEIEKILEEQLKLLHERAKKADDEYLAEISEQMISLAAALEDSQSADVSRFHCGIQLSGTDLTDMICGRETRLLRHGQNR